VLDRLAAELPLLKVLGSYPRDSSNDSLRSSAEGRS
jgi:hypothetical protein